MPRIDDALTVLIDEKAEIYPPNDAAFLKRIYASGLDVYVDRLRAIGFEGMRRVLDAGCGFGQWSLSLGVMNQSVTAIDISESRVDFTNLAAKEICPGKVEAHTGAIDRVDLPDAFFDGIFCYGVLFLTPWKETLAEFTRLLKPGGRLYVNANGFGWYKHLWYNAPNPAADYDPTERSARVLLNTWNYRNGRQIEPGMDILIEPDELRSELEALGHGDVLVGGEGTLRSGQGRKVEARPFFQSEYLGDTGVYEVLSTNIAA